MGVEWLILVEGGMHVMVDHLIFGGDFSWVGADNFVLSVLAGRVRIVK